MAKSKGCDISLLSSLCPTGTVVTKVTATDADEANSLHSKISYSITKQEPTDGAMLFSIDRNTGLISVKNPSIDREVGGSWNRSTRPTSSQSLFLS